MPSFSEWMFWGSSSVLKKCLTSYQRCGILTFQSAARRWWMDLVVEHELVFVQGFRVVDGGPPDPIKIGGFRPDPPLSVQESDFSPRVTTTPP